MTSLAGRLSGRLGRSLAGDNGGGVPFVGVIDLINAAGPTVTPLAALSSTYRLRGAYTGALYRGSFDGGTGNRDVPYDADANQVVNDADYLAIPLSSANNGACNRVYDQSGSGFGNWDHTGAGAPCWTRVMGKRRQGTEPVLYQNLAGAYQIASSLGLTGDPALTVLAIGRDQTTGADRVWVQIGNGSTFDIRTYNATSDFAAAIAAGTDYQQFDPNPASNVFTSLVATKAANADIGDTVLRQDGNVLAESTNNNPTNNVNISAGRSAWGGKYFGGTPMNVGNLHTLIVYNAVLTPAQITAFEDWAAPIVARGQNAQNIMHGGGQSNWYRLPVFGYDGGENGHPLRSDWTWTNLAVSGTDMTFWAAGQVPYNNFMAALALIPSGVNVIVPFPQGESDLGLGGAYVSNFASRRDTFIAAVQAARPGVKFILFTLHTSIGIGTGADLTTINNAITADAAALGADCVLIDPTVHGPLESDLLHWGPSVQTGAGTVSATQTSIMEAVDAAIDTLFP